MNEYSEVERDSLTMNKPGLMQDLLTDKIPVQVDAPHTEMTA